MNTYHGAIVLIAVLPLLALAMHLRRRREAGRRLTASAAGVSLALLICGIAAAGSL